MSHPTSDPAPDPALPAPAGPLGATSRTLGSLEQRGIEPVPEAERRGNPLELFWVWSAANISVLGLPLGVSLVAAIGSLGSFAVVGLVSIAGHRGGAPSLTLSRAVFGVRGNIGPTALALLSRLGWETVNTATAALAVVTTCALVLGTDGAAKQVPVITVIGVLLFVACTVAGEDGPARTVRTADLETDPELAPVLVETRALTVGTMLTRTDDAVMRVAFHMTSAEVIAAQPSEDGEEVTMVRVSHGAIEAIIQDLLDAAHGATEQGAP